MKIQIDMDISSAIKAWSELGHSFETFRESNGTYVVQFIKKGSVKGYIKAIPGEGFKWLYPNELLEHLKSIVPDVRFTEFNL